MIKKDTMIGKIRGVRGSVVMMALDPEIEISPIIRNRIHRITQVGSILKVKVGASFVIGHVVSANAMSEYQTSQQAQNEIFAWSIAPGEKSLELNLFGEIYEGLFERGVSSFPDISSEVHVIDENDLKAIYANPSKEVVPIILGQLSGGVALPAILDLQKFVMRHGAILGSTGSGKSNAVAVILKEIASTRFPNTKVIVTDIHGEYSEFLSATSTTLSLKTKPKLILPFWLLPFEELYAFIMGKPMTTEDIGTRKLKEIIYAEKYNWLVDKGLEEMAKSITVDSPIPYDLKKIWYDLYVHEHATYKEKTDLLKDVSWIEEGDYQKMIPPRFNPPAPGSAQPFKRQGQSYGTASILDKIRSKCLDKNYEFVFGVADEFLKIELEDIISSWIKGSQVTILDLSNIPSDVIDLCVGVISRIIFDLWRWGRDVPNFGRKRPVYMVFDEAHLYLKDSVNNSNPGPSIRSVSRILREGRKYGVGALIVSQRPSDINGTIFSQIGTTISLRLNNSSDLGKVKESLSDNLSNMADTIPALKTGEAFVSGEGTIIPYRAQFISIERHLSSDPKIMGAWDQAVDDKNLNDVIEKWKKQGD